MKEKFSAVILAAGSSGRMRHHKALLPFDPQRCFARKLADDFFAFGCSQVIMVTNQMVFDEIKCRKIDLGNLDFAVNSHPDWGRFYSLSLGCERVAADSHVFVTNVDNPFVNQQTLKKLWANKSTADYVCPAFERKGGHPILISPKVVEAISNERNNQINLKEFLNRFSKQYIDVDDRHVLTNINTLSDYKILFDGLI